jgi:hypothetical protein
MCGVMTLDGNFALLLESLSSRACRIPSRREVLAEANAALVAVVSRSTLPVPLTSTSVILKIRIGSHDLSSFETRKGRCEGS